MNHTNKNARAKNSFCSDTATNFTKFNSTCKDSFHESMYKKTEKLAQSQFYSEINEKEQVIEQQNIFDLLDLIECVKYEINQDEINGEIISKEENKINDLTTNVTIVLEQIRDRQIQVLRRKNKVEKMQSQSHKLSKKLRTTNDRQNKQQQWQMKELKDKIRFIKRRIKGVKEEIQYNDDKKQKKTNKLTQPMRNSKPMTNSKQSNGQILEIRQSSIQINDLNNTHEYNSENSQDEIKVIKSRILTQKSNPRNSSLQIEIGNQSIDQIGPNILKSNRNTNLQQSFEDQMNLDLMQSNKGSSLKPKITVKSPKTPILAQNQMRDTQFENINEDLMNSKIQINRYRKQSINQSTKKQKQTKKMSTPQSSYDQEEDNYQGFNIQLNPQSKFQMSSGQKPSRMMYGNQNSNILEFEEIPQIPAPKDQSSIQNDNSRKRRSSFQKKSEKNSNKPAPNKLNQFQDSNIVRNNQKFRKKA